MMLTYVLLITSACILSAQTQQLFNLPISFIPGQYSKFGLGGCPSHIRAMTDFDITKLYGEPWYLVAHYRDLSLSDRHCTEFAFSDANPGGKDVCRVKMDVRSHEYGDPKEMLEEHYWLLPNETDHSSWIDTQRSIPSKSSVLTTDYYNYFVVHECQQFPRDNPIMYEQNNYIMTKNVTLQTGGLEDLAMILQQFEELGVDIALFRWHKQDDCEMILEGPIQ